MSGMASNIPILNWFTGDGRKDQGVRLPPVKVHQIETDPERRARCLKHLLKANHVNYSVLYSNDRFVNHNAHVLCSSYLLGATEVKLNDIFNSEIPSLEPWRPSPAELMEEDWMDFLGNRDYQRAYLDFFEDQLAMEFAYDWKKEILHFLFTGEEPVFYGLACGLGHPLIHLGYAFEMDSREIATEALALAAVQYDGAFHSYLKTIPQGATSPISSESPLELLIHLSEDKRFANLPGDLSFRDLYKLLEQYRSLIMEYWNGWIINDPTKQFEMSQEAAVALLVATVRPGTHAYDFFLLHLLTSSHAVRILLPLLPAEHHKALIKEWWLLVLAVFIIKGRPQPDPDNVEKDLKGKHWTYVIDKALNSPWSNDAHYVKGIRAMREAATTWGDVHEHYLAAAVTFVDNFNGWTF